MLRNINTTLKKCPANATDLIQPADSFSISKIKNSWKRKWDAYKVKLIEGGERMNSASGSSGKLKNPGKFFFSDWRPNLCVRLTHKKIRMDYPMPERQ